MDRLIFRIKERYLSITPTCLNLGCGSRYHPDWINIDISPQGPGVIKHDLSRGIPFSDSSCDVVYHAAVLEHMDRLEAAVFMNECYRVLKPGGIVRVGVPDLEKICRLYLSKLEAVLNGNSEAIYDYDWIMLELYDQSVREMSGGSMLDFLRQNPLPNESFIYERIGEEGRILVDTLHGQDGRKKSSNKPILHKIINRGLPKLRGFAKRMLVRLLFGPKDLKAFDIGRFRLSGEVHQWMYDRYSLTRLLSAAGFHDINLQDSYTSQIPNWINYNLDISPDGQVSKSDLFFLEAIKPGILNYE